MLIEMDTDDPTLTPFFSADQKVGECENLTGGLTVFLGCYNSHLKAKQLLWYFHIYVFKLDVLLLYVVLVNMLGSALPDNTEKKRGIKQNAYVHFELYYSAGLQRSCTTVKSADFAYYILK